MNPISSFWLKKRQAKARALVRGSTILDVGSRSEKIREDAVTLDVERKPKPEVCASADYLPFKSDSFDYVAMLEVIEHLDDAQLEKALRECKRICRWFVMSTPNCDSKLWGSIVWPLWSHSVGREWIGAHKQFFGKASISELLEGRFGMKIVEKNYSHWNLLLLAETNPA